MEIMLETTVFIEDYFELERQIGLKTNVLIYYGYEVKDTNGSSSKYTHCYIPKKGGGSRELSIPNEKLRIVQSKVRQFLEERYKSPTCCHGGVGGKSIRTNALKHVGKKYILNVDLQDFFGSISSKRVYGLLKSDQLMLAPKIAHLLTEIVTQNKSLPQGSPASPLIANMISWKLDRDLMSFARKNRLYYSRYFDDITFSTDFQASFRQLVPTENNNGTFVLSQEFKDIITDNGFTLNESKTRTAKDKVPKYVTGVKVNTITNVPRRYVKNIRAALYQWDKFGLKVAEERHNALHGGNSTFKKYLMGRIAHLNNVRGIEKDPIYLKFRKKYSEINSKKQKDQ